MGKAQLATTQALPTFSLPDSVRRTVELPLITETLMYPACAAGSELLYHQPPRNSLDAKDGPQLRFSWADTQKRRSRDVLKPQQPDDWLFVGAKRRAPAPSPVDPPMGCQWEANGAHSSSEVERPTLSSLLLPGQEAGA
ncbi:hypothetical protein MANI_019480 [Metarhizium anisopliae]|nr:hypothetical protein MANI_019480 [Metarhizium anisopliae]